jgi:hypothetical protein
MSAVSGIAITRTKNAPLATAAATKMIDDQRGRKAAHGGSDLHRMIALHGDRLSRQDSESAPRARR